jgi:hypothetical protein
MLPMPKRLAIACFLLLAAAAAGLVRAGKIEVDFSPKAEFENYKTWGWVPDRDQGHHGVLVDAEMRKRVETELAYQLGQRGLKPAAEGATPDVLVRYSGDIGTGKTIRTSAGSVANMADVGYATAQFAEQKATLMVDLIDSTTKTLAWRLYLDQGYGGPNDPPDKIRKALAKGMAKYPPSASERKKKARETE